MSDALELVWPCFDAPTVAFSAEEIARWPTSAFEQLVALGVIREGEPAQYAACPNCPDHHVEEVLYRAWPAGTRYFIPCPEALRTEVSAEQLRRWTIDFDAVARTVSRALVESGRCTQLVAGRFWRLGRVKWEGAFRDVLLARGLLWPDGAQLATRVDGTGRAIVVVADHIPPRQFWPGLPAPVVSLSAIAQLSDTGISIDSADLFATVKEVDAANRQVRPLALTQKEQEHEFRKAAGNVLKSNIGDQIYVQAYVEHGSDRKAAAALTKQLGFKVGKDKVARAVKRAGGPAAVKRTADSDSVGRTVASQRRDRQRKFASPTQPPDLE